MGLRVSWIEFVSVSDNVFLEISSNSYFQNLMRLCSVMNGITDKLSKVEITCNCNRMVKGNRGEALGFCYGEFMSFLKEIHNLLFN